MDLNEFLAQLGITPGAFGGGGPQAPPVPQAPPTPSRPYVPFDTSQPGMFSGGGGGAFPAGQAPTSTFAQPNYQSMIAERPNAEQNAYQGSAGAGAPPLPAKVQMALQQEAQAGITGGGFAPQPRPPLPAPLAQGANAGIFAGFNARYSPQAPPEDPLATLMGGAPTGPGFLPQTPPSRALMPPGQSAIQAQRYGVGQQAERAPLTESEKTLLRQHPAYGRAIQRHRNLARLRAERGI